MRRGAATYQIIPYGVPEPTRKKAVGNRIPEYIERDSHNENHFLFQLPVFIVFRADFPVEMQQLLQLLAAGGHTILNYRHEQLRLARVP